MSERKKKSGYFYLTVVILVLVVAYILFNSEGLFRHKELNDRIESLKYELDTLRSYNKRLREEIDSLQKQYDSKIEQVAREKYNLKKENEKEIKIEKK
ncbi:MAG: septum formation initiator family protein [Ignavibacteriales bacterium]|jgi:cell division protein FtsB|nr:MAG: hypothetical protein F9K26_06625 [Ignavibacteriaceae bacterium]MBW7873218.1 septum formation initiator family protein [Ignavibacteria bacterium]MCZ2142860.1 septum formation initiator family protein [Ignavibacteriales bacterium]OQY70982.1 MAG: hypothetical protein B6D45_10585 [Ignavibacteriales bacterium UTCHB3]MBV6443954.1 Cell division protein FtsL [Ignavibacteriaceae bacterium]